MELKDGVIPGSPAADREWQEIERPGPRTYLYPNGVELFIPANVKFLSVGRSDAGHSHRLIDVNGDSWYVAAGWLAITWPGPFQF